MDENGNSATPDLTPTNNIPAQDNLDTNPTTPTSTEATPVTSSEASVEAAPINGSEAPAPAEAAPVISSATEAVSVDPVSPIANVATDVKTKNKKLPIIIGASVLGCALVGGGVFAIYRSNPDVVAYDAVVNLINTKSVNMAGTVEIKAKDNDSGIESMTIDLSALSNVPASASTSVKATIKADGKTYSVEFGNAMMSDGVLYIKIDGIKNTLKEAGLDTLVKAQSEKLYDLIGEVDGQWWKIDVPAILDELKEKGMIGDSDKSAASKFYSCLVDGMKRQGENSNSISKIYKNNKFVEVEVAKDAPFNVDSGNKAYSVKFNTEKMADYVNEVNNSDFQKELIKCIEDASGESFHANASIENVTADDFKDLEELPTLYTQIDNWGHKFTRFYVDYSTDETTAKADIKLTYQNQKVTAPENSKPITDLIGKTLEVVQDIMMNSKASSPYGYGSSLYDDDLDLDLDDLLEY